MSSIVLPEFSGVYDPHENPFPDSVEINHSSVEAFVGRGDSGLFYSFSLEAKQRVFITAKSSFNDYITPVLLDPMISLREVTGTPIAENDDWNRTDEQSLSDLSLLVNTTVGGTTLESLESALLLDLDPGTYTVIMNPMGTSQEGKGILSVSAFGISKISIRAHGEMGILRHGITLSELSSPHYDDPFIHPPYSASSQTRILASAKGAASLSQYGISNGMTDPSINIVQIQPILQTSLQRMMIGILKICLACLDLKDRMGPMSRWLPHSCQEEQIT